METECFENPARFPLKRLAKKKITWGGEVGASNTLGKPHTLM